METGWSWQGGGQGKAGRAKDHQGGDYHSRVDRTEDLHGKADDHQDGAEDHFSGADEADDPPGRSGRTAMKSTERLAAACMAITGQADSSEAISPEVTGQGNSSERTSIALLGQTRDSETTSLSMTRQAEGSQTASLAITGPSESWCHHLTRS